MCARTILRHKNLSLFSTLRLWLLMLLSGSHYYSPKQDDHKEECNDRGMWHHIRKKAQLVYCLMVGYFMHIFVLVGKARTGEGVRSQTLHELLKAQWMVLFITEEPKHPVPLLWPIFSPSKALCQRKPVSCCETKAFNFLYHHKRQWATLTQTNGPVPYTKIPRRTAILSLRRLVPRKRKLMPMNKGAES